MKSVRVVIEVLEENGTIVGHFKTEPLKQETPEAFNKAVFDSVYDCMQCFKEKSPKTLREPSAHDLGLKNLKPEGKSHE